MKNILVAYDGSLLSRKALEEAKNQAKCHEGSKVYILSIIQSTAPSTNITLARNIEEELAENLQPQMNSIYNEFDQEGIPVFTEILFGEKNENPGNKIGEYASNHEMDMILVGSRGLGKIKNILLGSVSYNIVHNATCPVLIMK